MTTLTSGQKAVGTGDGNCQPAASLSVAVDVLTGTTVPTNTRTQVNGTAKTVHQLKNCDLTETPIPFAWSLTFQPPGGTETNADGLLHDSNTLNPFFVPELPGAFRVRLTGHDPQNPALGTRTALQLINVVSPPPVLITAQGKLTLLRVSDFAAGFGPPTDFIDVEAIVQLDTQPGKSFGFQLRNDRNRPAHQGMMDLMRDAFAGAQTVSLDVQIIPGKNNGVVVAAALVRA